MINSNYIQIDEVTSTNEYLKDLLSNKELTDGFTVIAKYQNKGKGQGDNGWESEFGKNLTFSLLLKPKLLQAEHMFMISKVVSLGVVEFLNSLNSKYKFTIKWPNDIYYNNKKLGGILIENSLLGSIINYSIIGIGININQDVFVSNAPNPISLKKIFGEEFDLTECLNSILKHIDKWYVTLKNQQFNTVNNTYFYNLYRKIGIHSYKANTKQFLAQIINVENDGELVLKTNEDEIKKFYFKEVEFVL